MNAASVDTKGTFSVSKDNDKRQSEGARTNREELSAVELSQRLNAAIDVWAIRHRTSRSDAIRRLVELGLHAEPLPRDAVRLDPLILEDLAARRIGDMLDPSLSPEERERRIRRLIEGPPEFCDDRIDLPKHKA
jgi:hypothetical protein